LKIAIFETLKIFFLRLVSDSTTKLEDAHSKLAHHETAQAQNDPRKNLQRPAQAQNCPNSKQRKEQNDSRHKTAHIVYTFLYSFNYPMFCCWDYV
jgi:hypothetical protein